MTVKIDLSGLEKLRGRLADLENGRTLTLDQLLTPAFMSRHTQYTDVNAWWAASGQDTAVLVGAHDTPNPAVDAYVARSTDFDDWRSLLAQATTDYYRQQLAL